MNKKYWSETENNFLRLYYKSQTKEYLISNLNRSWSSIEHHALRMNLSRKYSYPWSIDDDLLLRKIYYNSGRKILEAKFPYRSWDAIRSRAKFLKLKSRRQKRITSNLEILLKDDCISLYWIGFLLADGHFDNNISNKGNYSISLCISHRDISHLQKFSAFIGNKNIKIKKSNVCVRSHDRDIVKSIMEKYGIVNNKTFIPPSKIDLPRHLMIAMIIGFIDGDGHITKRGRTGRIQIHKQWLSVLQFWNVNLAEWFEYDSNLRNPYINNQGYSHWYLDKNTIRMLKNEALMMNLPILERKWKLI